ncbi:MAG: TonB-dependent receptor [candidate division WOR-3 bacterium]
MKRAFFFLVLSLYGEEVLFYKMDPLIITASRIPTSFIYTTRNVSIITNKEIENVPLATLADLLKYDEGIDVRERGPEGVQADVSIGGTFEQTLVLVDGVAINDPQTSHHNLNIPIELEDIERIEILKGPGTTLYGDGAFSGVINIITKKERKEKAELGGFIGDYKLFEGNLSISKEIGFSSNRFSFSEKKSDGYRYNTDFKNWNFLINSFLEKENVEGDFLFGYKRKDFGANCFYSDKYPDQREAINALFFKGDFTLNKSHKITFHSKRHEDDYILDRKNPEWYRNHHITNNYGIGTQSIISSKFGSSGIGSKWDEVRIKSTNLGDHSYGKIAFFFGHSFPEIKRTTLNFSSSFSYYSNWGWFFYPGVDIGIKITDKTLLYASLQKSSRLPSYTELYYHSPANLGNPELKPEEAFTYEGGIKTIKGNFFINLSGFYRRGENIIDWVRANSTEPWRAINSGKVISSGVEINLEFNPFVKTYKKIPIPNVELGYSLFRVTHRDSSSLQSKYLMSTPSHKFIIKVDYEIIRNLHQTWRGIFQKNSSSENVFILDFDICYKIRKIEFFISITNLLNTDYFEGGWIPMPGRWARGGIKFVLPY